MHIKEREMQFVVNKNIRRILLESGQRQRDVAERAGMSKQVFSNVCRCKRKVYADEVVPIAAALGVGIEALFAEDGAAVAAG